MANGLPSDIYSGGAVTFNTQPTVNLYQQVLARQQAKWDAMDAYERSRINSINDAGVRDIDRRKLDDMVLDLQQYYQVNKDVIRKGKSQEAFDYEKKFRDVKDLIVKSKDRAARHEAALKFYNERLKSDQRLPDDFIVELGYNDMPVGEKYIDQETGEEKEYSPFDVTKWVSEAKPFTQDKYLKSFSDIKRTPLKPRYEKIEGQPFKQDEIIEETFDEGAKQVIAARATDRYDNSYSFATQVKNEIADPTRRKQLSDIFTKEYGITPSMPSDYAVAYTLELLQPTVVKSKRTIDEKAKMDYTQQQRREMALLNHGLILTRKQFDIGDGTVINVDELINEDGNFDFTRRLQGVGVKQLRSGSKYGAKSIIYNPSTKNIILDGEEMSVPTFKQVIKTVTGNTKADIKAIDDLIDGVEKSLQVKPKTQTKQKQTGRKKVYNPATGKFE